MPETVAVSSLPKAVSSDTSSALIASWKCLYNTFIGANACGFRVAGVSRRSAIYGQQEPQEGTVDERRMLASECTFASGAALGLLNDITANQKMTFVFGLIARVCHERLSMQHPRASIPLWQRMHLNNLDQIAKPFHRPLLLVDDSRSTVCTKRFDFVPPAVTVAPVAR